MVFSCLFSLFSTWVLVVFSQRASCYPSQCVLPFPRSYVVYHFDKQESIDVDGKLDDIAWTRVSWTEDFIGDHMLFSLSYPIAKIFVY